MRIKKVNPDAIKLYKLMDLIRCNATKPTHCKWLTLTYADAMTDHTKVYEDGKMFLRRFQRYLNKSEEIFDSQKTFKRMTDMLRCRQKGKGR